MCGALETLQYQVRAYVESLAKIAGVAHVP
jgi:hypothetical protein